MIATTSLEVNETLNVPNSHNEIEMYSVNDNWSVSDKYLYYDDYFDNVISKIDEEKNIVVDSKQINITQESNSQYIPFEMNRYYDGFDLLGTTILIHFVNKNKYEDFASPVNVCYNDTKIRFAWLVDKRVTSIEGKVEFEIQAIGTNSKGDEYIWKTKPNGSLNILKSLSGNGVIEPDETWMTGFLSQITEQVALAQSAAQQAQNSVSTVETLTEQVTDSVQQAQVIVDNAKTELQQNIGTVVDEKVSNVLSDYYNRSEVDEIVANIDISDQLNEIKTEIAGLDGLANFNVEYDGTTMTFYNGETVMKTITINSDPSVEWTTAYSAVIDEKISTAKTEVQNNLDTYKITVNENLENIHSEIDGLPETLQNDYYLKIEIDNKFATKESLSETNVNVSGLQSSIDTNKNNITTLSSKVLEIEEALSEIDTSPTLSYEATYDEEQIYTLWEIEGEGESEVRTAKSQFKIQGGSGGGTSSILKIEYVTKTPMVVTVNDKALITYNFSGTDSSGDEVLEGTATWKVGSTIVSTGLISSGENTFDVTDYLSIGTQKVTLSITDDAGSLVTKTWTVQKIDVRLESSFNDTLTYPISTISFDYIPYGAISKNVHFVLDGEEVGVVSTTSSGIPMAYTLPQQEHGSHLLEVYITADINGNIIESNHIIKDIIWYDSTSVIPVISCSTTSFVAKQYDAKNITYTVYNPATETPTVILAVDNEVISTLELDSNVQTWQFKSSEIGEHTLTITCGSTIKTISVKIEELGIDIEPVTAGLVFDFNPTGKSNNDTDKLWSDGTYNMSVSDNFDWINGGYQIDDSGDQYFCIKADTFATIDYKLFEDDAKRNGKEFKLIFKTTNVRKANAQFLTCVDGSDNAKIGIEMNVHEAYIHASAGSLYLPYSEEDIIEFEFNINKNTDDIPMVMGYEDGVASRPMIYSDSHNFTQTNPQYIKIGSPDCDVFIYRFKVYSSSLTDTGILNNFIADARNAEEMINRYNRNQIYDENNQLTPEILAEKCPQLRIIKIEAPYFTNNKSDKVTNTTIQMIYKNGDAVLDNWTAYNSCHSGQGTTSNEYGAAGRNLDLIMNKSGIDGVSPYIVLGDGTETNKISLTRNSVEVNYLNVKVNIASSENANNALLQKRYNDYNPYLRPARVNNSKVKDTMEFVNCVVFVKESDPDLSTHREFNDNEWHFYAIGNVGDSKKTDKTRLNDPADPLECIVEIMDNTLQNSTFPSGEEALANLEADSFDESMTYGWRYSYNDSDPAVTQPCIDAWKGFYKFVVNSTDEEFKNNLGNYFVVDSALYFYLFTTRYTMIDNRAKNTFWHYGKTGEIDSEGNSIRKWDLCFNYDNDTALGCNNSGELTMTYGYEDTDYKTKGDASTGYAFNAATSTFFCRVRDLFVDELRDMFVNRESAGAWSAEGLINQFDTWQAEFPEELWRLDIERKYLRPYRDGNTRFLNQMANGRKKYQRRQFERSQEKYMASKFFGNVAVSDQIMFRCNTPTDNVVVQPNYTLHLTPYSDMYLDVLFGATYRTQIRAEAGKQYDIECPFTTMDDTAVLIYCASQIQSMGDISACYIHDNDFSKASKLKELIIGNTTEGYQNAFLTNLGIGNNTLLEKLDIQNTPNLAQALNLSNCENLIELYAHGSGLTGVTFANGGKMQIAELPALTSMTIRNLVYLTDLDITSYDKFNTLIIENCSTVDIKSILEQATNINRVRIIGIDWSLDNTDLLDEIYTMFGIDKNGYNISQSVLTGRVHVSVIKQQKLYDYRTAWPDLEITSDSMIEQFPVIFKNSDGTILEIQYVDKGGNAIDPTTREENPLTPTMESSISHDFTFNGWDSSLNSIFSERIITATYTESLRRYTIKYVSKGITMQESTGLYGENIPYTGAIPIYIAEEAAYVYYLFNRWDKSGFIDGDKIVNAIFDKFEYTDGIFANRELIDLTPVEVYAMNKLGLAESIITDKDPYSFTIGNDIEYDDIESEVLISEKTSFTGSNYIDTGIKLFDEDKDFVLMIDYEFSNTNTINAVLAQCFQANGSNGFRLWYTKSTEHTGAKFTWGTSSSNLVGVDKREVVVIRHKKGDNNLVIYNSNLDGDNVLTVELTRTKATVGDSTLVFGCAKADDGMYENYAIGTINWCKLWYKDLGEEACQSLSMWTHEKVSFEVCGFRKYYLSENASKRCSFSLLATHLLDRAKVWHSDNTNEGGWRNSTLNKSLNSRLYNAIPIQIRSLLKQVRVPSSIGNKSTEIDTTDCYITVPACIEVDPTMTTEPYANEGTSISYMTTNDSRRRAYDGGDYSAYWLRSPNVAYANYVYRVDANGTLYGYSSPYYESGVLIEISF